MLPFLLLAAFILCIVYPWVRSQEKREKTRRRQRHQRLMKIGAETKPSIDEFDSPIDESNSRPDPNQSH
ncbi:hypothetical protein CGZ80_09500 [Rhodopirellula sp. MGV]|nr:hypothetical protein CGZ80_09500 [Rhodopirellula sp. MGV]PNY36658.1 hypothetical protein C2E31_12505 [Rhodopirellula baltica]